MLSQMIWLDLLVQMQVLHSSRTNIDEALSALSEQKGDLHAV